MNTQITIDEVNEIDLITLDKEELIKHCLRYKVLLQKVKEESYEKGYDDGYKKRGI